MFKTSTIQDIISILITSIAQIQSSQQLSKKDSSNLIKLANFVSGTQYRQKPFVSYNSLQKFVNKARKYSFLIKDK